MKKTSLLFLSLLLAFECFAQTNMVYTSVDAAAGTYTVGSKVLDWQFFGSVGQPLERVSQSAGRDEAGNYKSIRFAWANGEYEADIRRYANAPVIVFTLTLPNGQNDSLINFPDFNVLPDALLHFSYHNDNFAKPEFILNNTSTPWLLFDDHDRACVISPASHFIVAKMKGDGVHRVASSINEEVRKYPKGFTYSTIMVLDTSIRKCWDKWGSVLRALYHRKFPDMETDPLLKYYGYWTDNGADYYYNYDTTIGYANTLLKLRQYYKENKIPLGYMQLDSWWYEKSITDPDGRPDADHKNKNLPYGAWNRYGGLMAYQPDTFLFPKGLSDFRQQLGLPLAVHNRWIDPESPYRKKYKITGFAAIDPGFWKEVMADLKTWGVVCYEQDWLNYIYAKTPAMASDLSVGDLFAGGMANEADKLGIHLQYCMAMPRFFLQGLKYNNLTTIRTSDDRFNPEKWMPFLFTSQLAYATGALPWCDVFKSHETGNMILSVLSAGPVGTGDRIGKEDKRNIFLACREDGQLVRPDAPLLPLDESYVSLAEHRHTPVLAYTYTKHESVTTGYLFAFNRQRDGERYFRVQPEKLGLKGESIVFDPVSEKMTDVQIGGYCTDTLPASGYAYYIIAPVDASGIAFFGDKDKIAAAGKKRIASIVDAGDKLKIKILFAPGENEITLRGYSRHRISASKGDLQFDKATGMFHLTIHKPSGKNEMNVELKNI